MIVRATVPHVAGHRALTPEATEEIHVTHRIRKNKDVVRFVQAAVHADKVIAAVCHGPQLLI